MNTHIAIHISNIHLHVPSPGVLLSAEQATTSATPDNNAAEGTVVDRTTGLMWSKATVAVDKTWAQAKEAAGAVRLGGFTDWRLPTRKELLTLVDDTRFKPAIDTALFQCDPNRYWTGTVDAESPSVDAWDVGFGDGGCGLDGQGGQARVRAVRSVSPSASSQ